MLVPGGRSNPKHMSKAGAPSQLGFPHPSMPGHGNWSTARASGRRWEEARGATRQTLSPCSARGNCNLTGSTALPGFGTGAAGSCRAAAIARAEREGRKGGRKRSDKAPFSFSLPLYRHRVVQTGVWPQHWVGRGDLRPPATEESHLQHRLPLERQESWLQPRSWGPAPFAPSETRVQVTLGDKEGQKRTVRYVPSCFHRAREHRWEPAQRCARSCREPSLPPLPPCLPTHRPAPVALACSCLSSTHCIKEQSDADSAVFTPHPITIIIKWDPQLISPEELFPP